MPVMTSELARIIGDCEKRSWQTHGIRIRVDSIANDGRILICSVLQVRKTPLLRPMDTPTLVQQAELALQPLLAAGYTPMVTAIDWNHGHELRHSLPPIDKLDPIGLMSALRHAQLPFPRLAKSIGDASPVMPDSLWRRAISLFAV